MKKTVLTALLWIGLLNTVWAQATPGFNTKIPEQIMTSDKVETSIGTLEFFDGLPDEASVQKVYDNLDRIRATEVFLNFVPLASIEGLRLGMESVGIDACQKILLYDNLMDSNSLFLTGNTDTIYAVGLLDLSETAQLL